MLSAICIHREFNVWSAGRSSPIVEWLRALARKAHAECGGRGVGAIGGRVDRWLRASHDDRVERRRAGLVSAVIAGRRDVEKGRFGTFHAAPEEVSCARRRFENENLSMIGLRFKSDR